MKKGFNDLSAKISMNIHAFPKTKTKTTNNTTNHSKTACVFYIY